MCRALEKQGKGFTDLYNGNAKVARLSSWPRATEGRDGKEEVKDGRSCDLRLPGAKCADACEY